MKRVVLGVAIVALAGCRGDELARVAMTGAGQTAAATWTVKEPTKAKVWVDYDGRWNGHKDDPRLSYLVEVLDGATSLQTLTCATSTCNSRVCGSTVSVNRNHTANCECKTDCVVDLPRAGTFTVRATSADAGGSFSGKNASLVLRK